MTLPVDETLPFIIPPYEQCLKKTEACEYHVRLCSGRTLSLVDDATLQRLFSDTIKTVGETTLAPPLCELIFQYCDRIWVHNGLVVKTVEGANSVNEVAAKIVSPLKANRQFDDQMSAFFDNLFEDLANTHTNHGQRAFALTDKGRLFIQSYGPYVERLRFPKMLNLKERHPHLLSDRELSTLRGYVPNVTSFGMRFGLNSDAFEKSKTIAKFQKLTELEVVVDANRVSYGFKTEDFVRELCAMMNIQSLIIRQNRDRLSSCFHMFATMPNLTSLTLQIDDNKPVDLTGILKCRQLKVLNLGSFSADQLASFNRSDWSWLQQVILPKTAKEESKAVEKLTENVQTLSLG